MTAVRRSEVPAEFQQPTSQKGGMTESQERFLRDLLSQRTMSDDERADLLRRIDAGELTKPQASDEISRLLALPKQSSQYSRNLVEMPQVPDGRYAIMFDGTLKFYRVKTGKEGGRWAGFIFLDSGRGGPHGDLQWDAIKNVAYKKQVLELISNDPRSASLRFGQEVGCCGVCGRSLTDETSRAMGIGPICAGERGW